ncbi:hypothetical protein [Phytohabitans rumicis]|uniref:Uncharacterized protein n=1 Tax=Phytohabitans rumicis TaxID=1076125 RepID=A0A6V8KNI4_9ACTN|nr:hypothetical protein [Phytohabitans rumicis]GFJ86723.1 hypothetical protein Prum_003650 [Phytohabitans rumicis]
MSYVAIDIEGARRVGLSLVDVSGRAEETRQRVLGALTVADLDSTAPALLATVQDGLATLGKGIIEKADLAGRFTVDARGTATALGAPVDQLGAALTGLLGFARPTDLRSVFVGLPPPGADPALDAALGRLSPVLLGGEAPQLDPAQVADLRLLAVRLGIEHAGPVPGGRAGTEVFWSDFWADGRTVDQVLADPERLLAWVSGTLELDRRLAVATQLPGLVDVLASVDFATGGEGVDALATEVASDFAAIEGFLPGFLAGVDSRPPDATQLDQTLAFAARVGWVDPATGTREERFADAIAFLRANRALGSALLPTGFEGSPQPLAFFDAKGIELMLDLGRRVGIVTDATVTGLTGMADQLARSVGVDLTAATPPPVDQKLEQIVGGLLASQVPPAFLQTPGLKARFDAALTFLRGAVSGPELLQRVVAVVAAFRVLATTGAPALTERQLAAVVGANGVGGLGRSRLRMRGRKAVQKNPEFLLVTQDWGIPGGHKQKIGKFKVTWSFDDTGALVAFRRKKRSSLSRAFDTVKAIVSSIGDAFEENPFKAIVQVGKIALGALALVFPGTQLLGAAALALNVGDAAIKAIEGDWLGALSSGLAVFTAGASDVFGIGIPSELDLLTKSITDGLGDPTLSFLKDAKRAVDIANTVSRAIDADGLAGAIGSGLLAGATALGSGGQLLQSLGIANADTALGLARLGATLGDAARVVAPVAGAAAALQAGDLTQAFLNGLSAVSAGARVLGNDKGAFSSTAPGVDTLFEFDPETQRTLQAIAVGTGVVPLVTRAVQALDQGQAFLAGSFLAQAVQVVNDPNTTVVGDRAQILQRIADVAAVVESVVDSGANAAVAGPAITPVILQRLQLLVDAAITPPRPPTKSADVKAVGKPATTPVAAAQIATPIFVPANPPGVAGPAPADPPSVPALLGVPGFVDPGPLPNPEAPAVVPTQPLAATVFSTTAEGEVFGGELLSADAGNDALIGGDGDDVLSGGSADDTLSTTDFGAAGIGEVFPGFSLATAPDGWIGFSPNAGQTMRGAVIGDSFLAGRGLVTGELPQAAGTGVQDAIRQLQVDDPTATIVIRRTLDPGNPEIIPPVVPTLTGGPVIEFTMAAEPGANTSNILGYSRNHELSARLPQLVSARGADVVIFDTGGNDKVEGQKSGQFVNVIELALDPRGEGRGSRGSRWGSRWPRASCRSCGISRRRRPRRGRSSSSSGIRTSWDRWTRAGTPWRARSSTTTRSRG